MGFLKVYDLSEEKQEIEDIQKVSSNKDSDFGLKIEHGLLGSEEWWEAIKSGLIPQHIIMGIISKKYYTGHNDFAQFDIQTAEGTTSWPLLGDDRLYKVGQGIRLVYVLQKFKVPLDGVGEDCRQILTIELEQ